jgi:phosphohistidine swiveling domain-containing protein
MSVLKGLKEAGAISESAYDSFLHSIPTVSSQLTEDKKAYAEGTLSKDGLLSRYGHLRPNSYDILSRNYMQQQGHVLMEDTHQGRPHEELKQPIEYLEEFRGEIEQAMANIGLKIDLETLSDFMASAISGRERFKFEFMKNVNAVLECIAKLGDHFDLGREVLSFVPLDEFIKLESNSSSSFFESHIRRLSGQNEKSWLLSKQLRFPDLIRQSDEVVAYRLEAWRPNYITRKTVKARVVLVESSDNVEDLDGAIVCICAADPGYDWLFSHNIAGLITQYGGVASHMSIRAAEFGLPAAVGCGEYLFNLASQADIVHLDCEHHKIEIVE